MIKRGRVYAAKGKTGRYRCGRCGRTFVRRGGFEDMRKPDWAILRALNDFFKGHSPAAIADTLEDKGCRVHVRVSARNEYRQVFDGTSCMIHRVYHSPLVDHV